MRLTLAEAEALVVAALIAARTADVAARATARALVAAEADGQAGHGLGRVPAYAAQVRAGKIRGEALPRLEAVGPAAVRIDAGSGFAYPAIDLAIETLARLAPAQGIAVAAIARSHHLGQAGRHVERLAGSGLVALVVSNTPKAMAAWGGSRPLYGTNPLAFAAPLPDGQAPLVLDLALSVVARSRIVAAARAGETLPPGWAVDRHGAPTTDPAAALDGALQPIGGAKGAALALMVEILAGALTGSAFGWEATSFLDAEGGPPAVGHVLLALDPGRLSRGGFDARMGALVATLADEPGVRLPGTRRLAARARAVEEGLAISAALHAELVSLGAAAR
jgi:(2R)-3-sulfolactate dehydrogenase (NADP+)